MNKLLSFLWIITFGCFVFGQDLYFTSLNGQIPGNILSIDSDSLGNLFASTSQQKIFKSTNNGIDWQLSYQAQEFSYNRLNVISNQDIFAFDARYSQILHSSDSGNSWEVQNNGIKGSDIILTIAKTQTGKLLAGAWTDCLSCDGGGIYSSTDNGITWVFVDLLNNYINSIITGFNNKIFAASLSGVYLSTNDGVSWELKNSGMQQFIKYLTIDNNNIIYAATGQYGELMYKSLDEGENWIQCNNGLPNDEVTGCKFLSNNLFVSYKSAGIYRSTNSGNNWEQVSSQISNFEFNDLGKTINGNILSATSGGIFYSQNSGSDWMKLTNSISHLAITSLNCTKNSDLFVGTDIGGIFRSTDQGLSWKQINLIKEDYRYDVSGIEFFSEDTLYASVHGYEMNKTLFTSTNSGNTWTHTGIGTTTQMGLTCLYIDLNGKIYCGEFSKFFWSTNNGTQWVNQPCSFSWIKDIVSNGNGIVLAGTYGNGIYRSTNNGIGFIESGLTNQNVLAVAVDKNGVFYAGSDRGLYKSTDNGVNWIQVISPTLTSSVKDIKIAKNNTILAAGWGLFFSTDDGLTWQSVKNGIEGLYLTCLSLDSLDNVYVGSYNGVYKLNKAIPVELISFSSFVDGNNVTLNWMTATEINNYGFQIERRETKNERRKEWENIGFVNGNGTSTETKSYSYTDENLTAGKYQYRLKQIDFDGTFEYSNIIEADILPPLEFSLEQNYPNPFNPSTTISFVIPNVGTGLAQSYVTLKVYDVLGNEIAMLVNEEKEPGMYNVQFAINNLPAGRQGLASGIYFYKLQTGSFFQTRKMILTK